MELAPETLARLLSESVSGIKETQTKYQQEGKKERP
jgi:hypothetical protein